MGGNIGGKGEGGQGIVIGDLAGQGKGGAGAIRRRQGHILQGGNGEGDILGLDKKQYAAE